jgi:hypothetical protein
MLEVMDVADELRARPTAQDSMKQAAVSAQKIPPRRSSQVERGRACMAVVAMTTSVISWEQ